ncbi:TPA: hypothetical protein ACXYK5_002724 [Legionella pneumophila]
MRHNVYKKSALLFSVVLLSGSVFSASVGQDELAHECKYLGASLSQLAKANTKEYCSIDVDYSGVMMEQSAALIKANRIEFARENLKLVYRTLDRVRLNLRDCSYFSSMVRPYLEKTGNLVRELESESHGVVNEQGAN